MPLVLYGVANIGGTAMLGEKLGESSGKITGTRVLSAAGQDTKLEVSFQGRGTLLGVGLTDLGTYWQVIRPGGVLYGEGQVVMMTDDGDLAPWTGFGVGQPTGPGFAASYAVCGSFQTAAPKLARLNGVATAIEYTTAENGDYHWTLWEWKAAKA
jgi:hypothetical protein